MALSALQLSTVDPTPLFELFRGSYATELLTASVCHFNIFGRLAQTPRTRAELAVDLGITPRATVVLTTALRAMGLLDENAEGRLTLTPQSREHLLPGTALDIGSYIGLAAQSPGVLNLVESLRSNRPAQVASGTLYTFREGVASAMDDAAAARHLTLALAGRAKNVAPYLAEAVDLSGAKILLDIGGGTGIFAIAFLQKYPHLRAVVFDRGEVLKVAQEMAADYGVADRLECHAGDMFRGPYPAADVALLSNILHDWDVPECQTLVANAAAACPTVLVHDVFLNDALDGPLPHALFSTALFILTEGRLYSVAEIAAWFRAAGLQPQPVKPTLVHCGVFAGKR